MFSLKSMPAASRKIVFVMSGGSVIKAHKQKSLHENCSKQKSHMEIDHMKIVSSEIILI